ncbi:universal stress protein [Pararhodobacter sp.]|uniref:universal stress protein n=1 Tax=Pararhodobacter sp. TaxID=2127056 RepID=UPI002AFF8F97|nr:universal stress protein [Pararhodobacter sp.]
MFKTILLTIDLEHRQSWEKALPAAIKLAKDWDSTLHVLTVVPGFGTSLVEANFPPDYEAKALRRAKKQLDEILTKEAADGDDIVAHVGHGRVHKVILETLTKTGADLVVMASHAPDAMREFLVGSRADRVVRRSPVSVLVLRA